MKKALLGLVILLAAGFTVLLVIPSPIDAAAYTPPTPPAMDGPYAVNHALDSATLLGQGEIFGAEDVDVDAFGRVYGATEDGRIVRVDQNGNISTMANTGGRPLGLHWDNHGNLIICDAFKGLLSLAPDGTLTTLLTEVDGQKLVFTDDLEIDQDGIIYFSDASIKYDQKHYMLDMLESRPWGRLIAYDPASGQAKTVLDNLYFANGVALSKDQDFVLVNETYRYQITRYWIRGPKQGQSEIFIDNLPGFPDGVSSSGRGTFWVALPTVRNPQADNLHPKPFLKNLVAKLPSFFSPKPQPYGFILELDEQGNVLRSLHDPEGDHFSFVTSIQENAGTLYLGTLTGDSIAMLPLQNDNVRE
ncbi:SMP-30/gluconolactonase/LRE family protein [Ketobacter alkanivorans]|uniref:Gluconolactonase n=1 Tax=Ketobacter alkanivorans TaxID=1917421 RepID=A0A2K9LIS1_9GAMM|nr:SMP-30/gluconolactonase/LRE family protein [Ketobacter alkanivorans]AUM11385.1 gluconolactonase [Ketobacter alkanivorans]